MIFLTSRCWSSPSRIWKPCGSPASRQCRRSRRWQMPWKVPIQSGADGRPSCVSMRCRISAAALLVNVTARMPCGDTPSTCTSHSTRWVSTRVLPLPAPASTSVGSSGALTACRCASFSGARMWETSIGRRADSTGLACASRKVPGPASVAGHDRITRISTRCRRQLTLRPCRLLALLVTASWARRAEPCVAGARPMRPTAMPPGMRTWRASSTGISPPTRSRAVYAGRHEFDGRLPDLSEAALRRTSRDSRPSAPGSWPSMPAQLSESRQRERQYLLAALDVDLFWKKEAEWPRRNPAYYLGLLDPEIYLSKPYAPLETRMRAYIAYAREIPRAAAQIRANLRTPMPAPWIEYGVNAFGGFAQFYAKDVDGGLCRRQGPRRCSSSSPPRTRARPRRCRSWRTGSSSERKRATQDYALGPQLFARMVAATEQVDVPLARLQQIGQADMEPQPRSRCAECVRSYAPGQDAARMRRQGELRIKPRAVPSPARAAAAGAARFRRGARAS